MPLILAADALPGEATWLDTNALLSSGMVALVWSPDQPTDANARRFATWPELYAVLQSLPNNIAYAIVLDTTSTGPFPLPDSSAEPGGFWDFRGARIITSSFEVSFTSAENRVIAIQDGARIRNLGLVDFVQLRVEPGATQSVIDVADGEVVFVALQRGGELQNSSATTGRFATVANNGVFGVGSIGQAAVRSNSGQPVVEVADGGFFQAFLEGDSEVGANALLGGGIGSFFISETDSSSFTNTVQQGVFTRLDTFVSASERTTYTAGVPGNWAGSPPTTAQEAIDRLIAANPGA